NNKQVGKRVGLNQGTITSGFYANLYLISLDKKFTEDKHLNVDYYRYVDDIIIISPHADSKFVDKLKSALDEELKNLGLERSQEKTIDYDTIEDFLEVFLDDQELESLGDSFKFTIYKLWLMNSEYRTKFRFAHHSDKESLWWDLVKSYQQALVSIDVYFTEHYLSRKIYQSIFKNTESRRDELLFPPFPNNSSFQLVLAWKKEFKGLAQNWLDEKEKLKNDIVQLLHQSIASLEEITKKEGNIKKSQNQEEIRHTKIERRRQEKRIRFAVNKLAILGFNNVTKEITDLIKNQNIVRNLLYIIVALARQGQTEAIQELRKHYEDRENDTSEYFRAVILEAMRFLPSLNIQDWDFIFKHAIEGKSHIERLKATESWLYLSNIAKDFVQVRHLQSVSKILETQSEIPTRLKKNYILLLGVHDPELLTKVQLSEQEQKDYLVKNSLKLALEGKVQEVLNQDEPAILRQYYSLTSSTSNEEEDKKSL
ncbi:MAG: RNA-directed DNA polymerase, partial [Halothece sp.]